MENESGDVINQPDRVKIIDSIKDMRLFSHLPYEMLLRIIPLSEITEYPHGSKIIKEGQIDNTKIFFLLEGNVKIYAGNEYILTLRRKGDIFGEMSVITDHPCSADVVADSRVTVLSIKAKDIGKYSDSNADLLQDVIFRLFSVILAEKLELTTKKAKNFEAANRYLENTKVELALAKLDLDAKYIESFNLKKKLVESEEKFRRVVTNSGSVAKKEIA